jgi:hypothetical protein
MMRGETIYINLHPVNPENPVHPVKVLEFLRVWRLIAAP